MGIPDHNKPRFNCLLAIGVGLIGGSVCMAARRHGQVGRLLGYSRKLETTHEALELGLIDECLTDASDPNVRKVDAVVLSIPVQQYETVLRRFLPVLPANSVIFDAGSTKADVQQVVSRLSVDFPGLEARFVGCHPIAGGEKHGPSAARYDLFAGRPCVICPGERSSPALVSTVEAFWAMLGADVRQMDPLDHDEMFGAVSHLPHLLAFAYVAGILTHPKGKHFMAEGGAGFRDFTRIAASSPEMWADIFENNDVALLGMLDRFQGVLGQLRTAIESKDRKTLDELIGRASGFRSEWGGGA